MPFWLAQSREGQYSEHIPRFDPRFWTVDFPRPAMASVTTMGTDSLRVDCELHRTDSLIGLIWESADRFDHPLLAYATDRDYSRTTLSFRWRSQGLIPLDAVNGPTLTIEGRDASGAARVWFVRIWNYAEGSPINAAVTLPFSQLREGFFADGEVVNVSDIDRMFISLVAPGFDSANSGLLLARVNGFAELTGISCDGDRAMLEIGEVLLPPHDIGIATAYDDSYHLTPARLLRNIVGLGYRAPIIHYVGMSHYFRLAPAPDDSLLVVQPAALCTPCEAWHASYFALCAELDYQPIVSLSYELFAQHCPQGWMQRAFNGDPALTGWVPPSSLLSPANPAAMQYLQDIAAAFVASLLAQGLPVHFQIGEPWWWVTFDGRICLYDDAVKAARTNTPDIPDLSAPMTADQRDLLDWAGAALAASTAALSDRVQSEAAGEATTYLLIFTPTILDPLRPELRRANMPTGWAAPAFDRLQVEDYDWLTAGAAGARRTAYETVQERLQYPLADQDYLAGFVLRPDDAGDFWQFIEDGLEEARERGVAQLFVWAFPQITRDGFTRMPLPKDDDMQAFDDVLYPLALGRDAAISPEFSTTIAVTASGHERRASHWSDARMRYDVGPGIRSDNELGVLLEFFRARRGAARGFRLADPYDHSSNTLSRTPTSGDQLLGVGDGETSDYQLIKSYGTGPDPQVRPITRPRASSIVISIGGVAANGWALLPGGMISFADAPPDGTEIRAGFLFDVPVRFAEDRLDISAASFAAGEAPSVPLIEVREAV